MAYLGRTPSQATRSRYYFTASGGETSLSGNDSNGNTLIFTDGNFVDVNLNGATLVAGSDYNTTTANTIAGLAALAASDVVEIVVYDTFSVFGGNVLGDFTVSNGTLTAEAVAISSLSTTGNITFGDNDKAIFGAGSDLQIYHDGSTSFISDQGTGNLKILAQNFIVSNPANTETMIAASPDGAVSLYHDAASKLATASSGVDVTGTVTADGLTVDTADQVLINHSGDGGGIRIDSTNATNTSSLRFGDVADNYIGALEYNHSNDSMTMYVNNAERMRIDSSGNVVVGGTSAQASDAATLMADGEVTAAGFYFSNNIGSAMNDTGIRRATTNTMVFDTASTERMRIDSSGNLLVGQASQDTTETGFSARANSLSHFCRDTSSTGSGVLLLNKKSGSGDVLVVQKDGTTFGTIGVVNANNMYLSGSASNHAGVQFGTQNVTPYNNGSESNGAVDLGASNLRWKDLYLSGGAYLGGTGAANKLDDYEEGTWTPAVVGGTQTASVVSAHYTKIGRLVTLNVYIQLSNVTNSTYLIIGGLPFTVDGYTATNIVNAQYNDTDRTPLIRSQSNSTNAEVIYATGNQLGVTQTNLNGNFIFTLTYEQQ